VIFFVVTLVYAIFLREPRERQSDSRVEETPQRLMQSLKELWANPDPVTLFFFGSVLFVFMAQQSVTTWFTLYASERFKLTVNEVTPGLLALGGMLVLAAIPGGYIGARFGRRRAVLGGMVGMFLAALLLFIAPSLGPTVGAMALFGISLITVVVNTYPMALELCRPSQVGTYTGLYYMCQYGAGIFGPALVGLIFDLTGGKRPLFIIVALYAVVSMVLMLRALKSPAIAEKSQTTSAPAAGV
jgi:maltose/moltooligosaccharide transporter